MGGPDWDVRKGGWEGRDRGRANFENRLPQAQNFYTGIN